MGKDAGTISRFLVTKLALQFLGIDGQNHEIGLTCKEPRQNLVDLSSFGAVNETLFMKRGSLISTDVAGRVPGGALGNVMNHARVFRIAVHFPRNRRKWSSKCDQLTSPFRPWSEAGHTRFSI